MALNKPDRNSIVDTENNTVSATTTHFSKYLLVDRQVWYDAWKDELPYTRLGSNGIDFAFVVDVSGSMRGDRLEKAKEALNLFADTLTENNTKSLITFSHKVTTVSYISDTIDEFKEKVSGLTAGGGTSMNAGLNEGLKSVCGRENSASREKIIVLLCDGDVENCDNIILNAVYYNVKIYTINVVEAESTRLKDMAERTQGKYYEATTSNQLNSIFNQIFLDMDTTDVDTDGDGLPDILETQGMRAINGKVYYSNPNAVDSDNDGVSDGEEMGIPNGDNYRYHTSIRQIYIGGGEYKYHIAFDAVSDPMNADSDGDGILDNADPRMLNKYNNGTIIKNFDKDREKVKILQMCLEYLGYLEMPIENGIKTNYGTFGGVTYSAVQLFQLNYGFSPLSDDLNNEMDSMTFATIINVAVNRGLIIDDISTSITDKEALYNDYCDHVGLNRCKKYSVSIYNNPPPINNKEKSAGVTNVKLNSIYYYDYTKPINNLLDSHVYECQYMSNFDNTIKFIWFINKVDHGKEWDIKRDNRWNEQFEIYGINYKSAAFEFYYNGILITPECLGNITYGYWGTAANIDYKMLLLGGDVASFTSGIQHWEVGIDSWEDKTFILWGVSLYNEQRT